MKRLTTTMMCLTGLALLIGCAAATPVAQAADPASATLASSTQPALPPGHPDISAMTKPAAPPGSVPAGHPDISQMTSRQAGPAGSAMPAGVNLPAGHPDARMKPTTQPAILGVLAIRAVQSTGGAPAVGADPFVAEFYIKGQLLDRVEGKLDPDGTSSVGSIPLRLNPQAIVKVTHGGVEFEAVSQAFDAAAPRLSVDVPVYESTEQAPPWSVKMRHVMVTPGEGGLKVVDMLAVENPSDRAWIGTAGADGKRATFALTLPEGATDIKILGGLHDCCTKIDGGKLTNTMALVPGQTEYQISYFVAANNGKAEISIRSPATTAKLMVMLPDDGTAVIAEGLEHAGSVDMSKGKTRLYKAAAVPADQELKLSITGIAPPGDREVTSLSGGSTQVAQMIAAGGAVVIVLFGAGFLLLKASPKKA